MAVNFPDISINNPATGAPWADGDTFVVNNVTYVFNDDGTNPVYWSVQINNAGGGGTPNLQDVTDAGNTTTNEIVVDGINIGGGVRKSTDNIRIGRFAMTVSNAGNGNVAVGTQAMRYQTSGLNTAVGYYALNQNKTGGQNTGLGVNALRANETGDGNTATGSGALQNTTGSQNIGIGSQAGNSIIGGSNNTIIGSLTGTAGMANTMLFGSGTTERFRVDADGRMLVGTDNIYVDTPTGSGGFNAKMYIAGSANNNNGLYMSLWNNSTDYDQIGVPLVISRSKSGTVGTFGALSDGNSIGTISFNGDDGSKFVSAAAIEALVDGTPGTSDMPGRLVFSTTADNAGVPTERMRIDNTGRIILPTGTPGIQFGTPNTDASPGGNITAITSQTLDDYEEGTWTPDVGGGATYVQPPVGRYTKIGDNVHAEVTMHINSINAGHPSNISGLPFATGQRSAGTVGNYSGLSQNVSQLCCMVDPGAPNEISFTTNNTGGTQTSNLAVFTDNTTITAAVIYSTTA